MRRGCDHAGFAIQNRGAQPHEGLDNRSRDEVNVHYIYT